ncbi:MAG: PGF-pre-PGF domain-containing protein, partial [Methanosarcina sp.]
GIDRSSIVLNRYSDSKWNQLSTSLSGEDDGYMYFTAETPGFSPFAVTSKTAVKESGTEMQSESSTADIEENTENTADIEQQSENEENTSTGKSTPGFEIIYGIAGLFAVSLYRRK